MTSFVAVIPAGGAGTRLWPLSRQARPKFLLDMTGSGRSLLQQTVSRMPTTEIMVVTGTRHAEAVNEQVPDYVTVLAEPSPRDSMPAIGLACALIERTYGPNTVFGSFAADHVIGDESAFKDSVRRAIALAKQDYLVTIGITPTHGDTGFGYIQQGDAIGENGFQAASFLEKPDSQTAEQYVSRGGYLWNAGMFVAKAGNLMDWLAAQKPELAAGLRELAATWGETDPVPVWETLEKCVIDRALAEPLADQGKVAVVPADMGWSDIGNYAALGEHITGVQQLGDTAEVPVVCEDSDGAIVYTHSRPIVVNGIPGAVVVDAGDVIYVSTTATTNLSSLVPSLTDQGLNYLK